MTPDWMASVSTLPAPTGGSWSTSPAQSFFCWQHASGACKLFGEEKVAVKAKELAEFRDWHVILAA